MYSKSPMSRRLRVRILLCGQFTPAMQSLLFNRPTQSRSLPSEVQHLPQRMQKADLQKLSKAPIPRLNQQLNGSLRIWRNQTGLTWQRQAELLPVDED